MNRRLARIALAALSPIALLGAAEIALRVVGFGYDPVPVEILIGDRDPIRIDTEADPDLFWTMRRDTSFDRLEARFEINALGTRGPLPDKARRPGTLRVVCLGDSTAFGNHTSYPRQLEQILRRLLPDVEVRVINAGVPGFSSWQGLRMLERDLLQYAPDLVTWCFGFNNAKAQRDGRTDAARAPEAAGALVQASRLVMRLRIAQAIKQQIDARRTHDAPFNPDRPDLPPRVPPTEHRELLARAAALAREGGARFLAITQPHALRFDETVGDDSLLDPAILATVHEQRRRLDAQSYAVRAECRQRGIPLLDLAAILRDKGTREWCQNPWPGTDSIHPNPLGARLYAEEIVRRALEGGLLPDGLLPDGLLPDDRAGNEGQPEAQLPAVGAVAAPPLPPLPPLPAFTVGASAVIPFAADRDGDGEDEVLCAATHDDRVHAAWWNPRSGEVTEISPPPLARGDQIVSLAVLPSQNQLLVTALLSQGRMFVTTRLEDGSPGSIAGAVVPAPGRAAHLLVEPLDLDGDGRTEYLVGYGPAGTSQLLLLSDRLQPIGSFQAAGGRTGPWLRSGRILSENRDHALISFETGPPDLRIYGIDRQFQRWIRPTLGLIHVASRVAPGRYRADSPVDGIALARGAAVAFVQEDGSTSEPAFPFGAVRRDASLPEPGGAVWRHPDGEDQVFLASRVGDRVTVVRIEGERVSAAFEFTLP